MTRVFLVVDVFKSCLETKMKSVAFAFAAIMLTMSGVAASHPRTSLPLEAPVNRAHGHKAVAVQVGEPNVRIRGDRGGEGLTPLAFAHWVEGHPRLVQIDKAVFLRASNRTSLLNRSSPLFAQADSNDDGRVSANELADLLDPTRQRGLERVNAFTYENTRADGQIAFNR